MKTVNVAVLKQELSSYLHMAEEGEEIVVTAHRRPVARVVPERRGIAIRPPVKAPSLLRRLKGVALGGGPSALQVLLEDRSRR